jgi:hypothetical protein
MKRINPNTGQYFEKGDLRDDGYLFYCYRKTKLTKKGFYVEAWLNPIAFERARTASNLQGLHRSFIKYDPKIHKKSVNPETGKEWIIGEQATNGKYFFGYKNRVLLKSGKVQEIWCDKETFKSHMITRIITKTKRRCEKKNIPFNIDRDYMLSIFPKDSLCPATNRKMNFGGVSARYLSPSIDRTIPAKGYIKGNVRWVSYMANAIMNEFNADDILKVGHWLKEQQIDRGTS